MELASGRNGEDAFKAHFQAKYMELVAQGLSPNDAVAMALQQTQQHLLAVSATSSSAASSSSSSSDVNGNVHASGTVTACVDPDQVVVALASAAQEQEEEEEEAQDIEMVDTPLTVTEDMEQDDAEEYDTNDTAPSTSTKTANGESSKSQVTPYGIQLERCVEQANASGDFGPVKRLVYEVFSDNEKLNGAFVVTTDAKTDDENSYWWRVDRPLVQRVFALLLDGGIHDQDQQVAVQNTFRNALEMLVNVPWNSCSSWQRPRALRFFLILFECPLVFDPEFLNVVGGLCKLFFYCASSAKQLLRAQWQQHFSNDELMRLLQALQQAITVCLYSTKRMELAYAACSLMKELYDVNESRRTDARGPFASFDEFYNDAVNSEVDLIDDYARSVFLFNKRQALRHQDDEQEQSASSNEGSSGGDGATGNGSTSSHSRSNSIRRAKPPRNMLSELCFCDFPFVLDAASKSRILQVDSDVEQQSRFRDALFSSVFSTSSSMSPYLILRVRREYIIQDALQQLVRVASASSQLKKPLKVKFIGEEGIDEGGVQKEFFQILIRQLLDPSFGMFVYDETTRCLWFNCDSLESCMEFELIGVLLGLAIYNSVILDLHFPHIVYKKLLGETVTLEDVEIFLPELGKGLRQLLQFDGNVEETYCRNFEYSYEMFGEVKTIELKPGGSQIAVTNANRREYVELYVDHIANKSVSKQFDAFARGFNCVCGGQVLKMFNWEELQLLICGSEELDFDALEKATIYQDGFDENSQVIVNFWSVVHEMSMEDKKKLLKFCTGSDRVPIRGLSNLLFVISRNGPDSDRLPTAHTCFNHLLLPEYSTREKLKERLLIAISQAEGFGLR